MIVGFCVTWFILGLVSYTFFDSNEDGLDLLWLICGGLLGPITFLLYLISKESKGEDPFNY